MAIQPNKQQQTKGAEKKFRLWILKPHIFMNYTNRETEKERTLAQIIA